MRAPKKKRAILAFHIMHSQSFSNSCGWPLKCNVSSTFFGRQEEKLDVKNEKVEFIFPNFFSRLQPYLFLPRPYYYFSSVFCPEMFQNLLFFWKKQTFIVFPREGRNVFCPSGWKLSLGRVRILVVPRAYPCCPSG